MENSIRRFLPLFCIVVLTFSLFGLVGCSETAQLFFSNTPEDEQRQEDVTKETFEPTINSEDTTSKTRPQDKEDKDDVIVAGSVDTASKYSLSVKGAFMGMDKSSTVPAVILVCDFTNNSNEKASFGSALEAHALQGSKPLSTAYLSGITSYNYDAIGPGETIPVYIAWSLVNAEDNVEFSVIDRNHYAKKEIFSQTYTLEELVNNSLKYVEEYENLVNEGHETIL